MSIFDENIKIIQKDKPNLYDMISKLQLKERSNKINYIDSINTREKDKALIINIQDKEYKLNSSYYPTNEVKQWMEKYNFDNLDVTVIMFGLGNGIFARELLKKLQPNSHLILYEPSDEIFLYTLKNYNLEDLWNDRRLSIFIGEDNKIQFSNEIGARTHWTNIYSQILCKHSQYDKAFMDEYKDFLLTVHENNERTLINRNTESFFGKTIVENTIANMSCIKESNTISEYYEKFHKDIPAIIVSAGPSLDKNIDELKRAKGKAVIVATDTALRYLFAHDIDPDFIVTIDPKKPAEYFANPRCKNIPIFCKIESNNEIIREQRGRKILFSCHPFLNELYSKVGKVISTYTSGGSVATGAFSVCAALKFNKIILIGQDLAYGEGVTHAGGEISNIHFEEEGIRLIEDINGNPIKTRHDWYIYLKWFESSIELIPDIQVIDATEGGAKIKGAKLMTLSDVIDQYCIREIDIKEIFENTPTTFDNIQLEAIKSMIRGSLQDLDEIIKDTSSIIPICNKLISACKANKLENNSDQMISEIMDINSKIEKKPVYLLIDSYISEEASKKLLNIYQISHNEQNDKINTLFSTKEMYELIRSAAIKIKPLLEEEIIREWN